MNVQVMAGLVFYGLSIGFFFAVGLVYLTRSSFMPYHQQAAGVDWDMLDKRLQLLLRTFMIVAGSGWLALAACSIVGLYLLLMNTFQPTLWLLFQALYTGAIFPVIGVALRLRWRTGAVTPVGPTLAALLLSFVGFGLIVTAYH